MNGNDFGPGSPGCIDCMDGHCTMNCSSRGRADLPTRREEARTVLHMPAPPEPTKAIALLLQSRLPEILIYVTTPSGDDRPHPLYEILGNRPRFAIVDDLAADESNCWIAPVGNLHQPGGSLDTSEREQLADLAGLKIFADPRVPPGEMWMGVDLSSQPDMTARFYRDANGNYHIIKKGDPE